MILVVRSAVFLFTSLLGVFIGQLPAQSDPQAFDFFEKKIRPVLVEKCYVCHGSGKDPMGNLRVDSQSALLKGGSRGAAVTPGNPDRSLLIRAIRYRDLGLKMPPSGKLSAQEIEDFETWVRVGAPDPRTDQVEPTAAQKRIDLAAGKKFWAFRPLTRNTLPAAQTMVRTKDWATSPIDYFILAKLEENGLFPAASSGKRTLIRRITFDLLGLPPTRNEIDAFLADSSDDAFEKLVDRLLASPHYGERWARHWLDLVRFAETNGHEFDNNKLDAWRYRDYVIRALNDDIPYDQFVKEHIAGDLAVVKRISNDGTHWESPLATGFYWFGEVLNSPTDSVKARADRVDNQIDVLSKAFLGLTVACARCHDHKFDPIPTADYYSLAGILHSTAIREASINSDDRNAEISALRHEIGEINGDIRALADQVSRTAIEEWKSYLNTAVELMAVDESEFDCQFDESATKNRLDRTVLNAWLVLLQQAAVQLDHPFYPLAKLALPVRKENHKLAPNFAERLNAVRQDLSAIKQKKSRSSSDTNAPQDTVYEDFNGTDYGHWVFEGLAFGKAPTSQTPVNQPLAGFVGETIANSFGSGSDKLVGSLTTSKFRMPKIYVHIRMAGTPDSKPFPTNPDIRVTIDADGHKSQVFTLTRPHIWQWVTRRMTKEIGRVCYIEIVDRSPTGHIAVDKIVFSDSENPPWAAPDERVMTLISSEDITSLDALIERYVQMYSRLGQDLQPADTQLLASLHPPLSAEDYSITQLPKQGREKLLALREQRQSLEEHIPKSFFGMVSTDENPGDIAIHQRGNHKNLGAQVPRRFLQVLAGENQHPYLKGSGRLQLAKKMVSSENPLAARVIANRVWKHHFGSGIVTTTDNFGKTGKQPTHPELLDYLAGYLVDNNWSLKKLHRLILLSNTYRMSSHPSSASTEIDPENMWLQHARVKRLEAEAIRDAILAVSGSLNPTVGGPGIGPFITPYQDGRGKPTSGPLDGNSRRSIYLQVRRNFITPIFLAFDYPPPISTIGGRGVSTVPSQALMMMNNEFISREAELWADRLLAFPRYKERTTTKQLSPSGAESEKRRHRIHLMFETAFGRIPDKAEVRNAEEFLHIQKTEYTTFSEDDPRIWADLAHVLFNSTEFIFVW